MEERKPIGDDALITRFYMELVEDKARSAETGLPWQKEVEYVEIRSPADALTIRVVPVTPEIVARWPARYEKFKKGHGDEHEGTMLKEWPSATRSMVHMLNYLGIFTMEQLANVSDTHLGNLGPGGRDLIARAQTFLKAAKGNAVVETLQAEKQALEIRLATMEAKLAAIANGKTEPRKRRSLQDDNEQAA